MLYISPPDGDFLVQVEKVDMSYQEIPSQFRFSLSEDGTKISLDRCMLSSLPAWLRACHDLTTLHLSFNQLDYLPEWIGELTNLTKVDLGFNQLVALPESIGNLTNLTELNLVDNHLAILPNSLGNLVRLAELNLVGNELAVLPDSIGNLAALAKLNLERNDLVTLPSSIGKLGALTEMRLYHNHLTNLPSSIGNLSNLTELQLADNELRTLPDSIGNLAALTKLNLKRNKLIHLPGSIGNLTAIKVLDLADNELGELPSKFADLLGRASAIHLENNSLDEPLPEIVKHGTETLAAYLRSLDDASEQYEAKILLVGENDVGKTSLVAALRGDSFVEKRPVTDGVEISPLAFRHPTLGHNMTLQVWDYGGQEQSRASNQFTFSHHALYIIVWHARRGQDQIYKWMRSIRLRVGGKARIILVSTHCEHSQLEADYSRPEQEFGDILVGSFRVDNRTGTGIPELRHAIAEQTARLPQMGQRISSRWLAAWSQVLRRAEVEPQIRYEAFREICAKTSVSDQEIIVLIRLLNDLGNLIYYDDDEGLKDIVFLNLEWLTNAISCVLEDESTRAADGVLSHARLTQIWHQRDGWLSSPVPYYPYLLRLMEKFDISCRLKDDPLGSLVAERVPHQRPRLPWECRTQPPPGIRSLALIYRLSEPAPELVPWLTVRHYGATTGLHWQRGVFLRHPIEAYASEAILEFRNPNELVLEVRAPSPDLFFNVLRESVEKLIRDRLPGLSYQLDVACPGQAADGSRCSGLFSLDGLRRLQENGHTTHACVKCARLPSWEISSLITGYTGPSAMADYQQNNNESATIELARKAAATAHNMRCILQAISFEVTDCPRLLSITPYAADVVKRPKYRDLRFLMTMWCEHPGYWHPWSQAHYQFGVSEELFTQVKPYIRLILSALQLAIPFAGPVAVSLISAKRLTGQLQMMGDLVGFPAETEHVAARFGRDKSIAQLTMAESVGLRAIRTLLFEQDPQRTFGGLRCAQTASGDFLWICTEHYPEYDPGLPTLPS